MRLIFHGQLRNLFGASFDMNAESVREALEGFSVQVDWPKDMLVTIVAGDEKLGSEDRLKEFHEVVHVMPAMVGGGGKFLKIIVGSLLVVVGVLVPGMQFLIPIGASMVLSGVMQLFMKSPSKDKNNDPEASKYLAINKNTTAVGTVITLAWGRIDMAGQWLSLQSDSNNLTFGVFPTTPT